MSFDNRIEAKAKEVYVSIPFEQGNVFRHTSAAQLSTKKLVSIPFEQGDVFRCANNDQFNELLKSQSLSSRAMSFDDNDHPLKQMVFKLSQSLSSRAMSFDRKDK